MATPDKLLEMASASTAEQFELISDDPRVDDADLGPLQLIRAWRKANADHPGGLIARPLAAEILGISTAHISSLVGRGRFTDVAIGPCKLLPVDEVMALWRERRDEGLSVGGRGKKLPSMAEVIRLGAKVVGE